MYKIQQPVDTVWSGSSGFLYSISSVHKIQQPVESHSLVWVLGVLIIIVAPLIQYLICAQDTAACGVTQFGLGLRCSYTVSHLCTRYSSLWSHTVWSGP